MAENEDFSDLKKTATKGAVWTIGAYGFSQALRFCSNLILTRLLFPELFGLMALVQGFYMIVFAFSDIGIGPSIIRSKRGEDQLFLNTAWTMQIIRGGFITLATVLLAFPLSSFYHEPRLLYLLPLVSVASAISGFMSTAIYTINRSLQVKRLVLFETSGQVIQIVVTIALALIHPSVWALIFGNLASVLIRTIWSFHLLPVERNRLAWDRTAVSEIMGLGKGIFFSTALSFMAAQAASILLPKIFSFAMMGVYTVAFSLADMPRQVNLALAYKVIFPTISKLADLPRPDFRRRILNTRVKILLLLSSGMAVLISFGDLIVRLLYDERYHDATWMLPLLAIGVWPALLAQTMDPVLLVVGKPKYSAIGNGCRFAANLIGIPLGFHYFGVMGALVSVALNDLVYYVAINVGLVRQRLSAFRQDLLMSLYFIAVLGALVLGRWALGFGQPFAGLHV